ncbi:unnamed protein product [Amaranthus hypochondriacus]
MFEKIEAAETSHKAWDILNKVYQGNTRIKNVKLQHLKSDFESLKMKRSETASEYVDNVTSIVKNMKALGHDIKECDVVSKILCSMTSKYETIVCMLDEGSIKEAISLDEVLGTLMVHEKRQNSYEPEERTLQAKHPYINKTILEVEASVEAEGREVEVETDPTQMKVIDIVVNIMSINDKEM